MCRSQEPMVIIVIKTKLADMTTTLDSGPVSKTMFTHSLIQSAQPTTRRAPFADGSLTQNLVHMESLSTRGGKKLDVSLGSLQMEGKTQHTPDQGVGVGGICTGPQGPCD